VIQRRFVRVLRLELQARPPVLVCLPGHLRPVEQ
jgi:hypothetical protein